MEPILEVRNLGLRYTLQHEKYSTLKERLVHLFERSLAREYLWAVRGVDFRLERGKSLGIIGRNGSGKSSMLKVLSGVLPADEGSVQCRGRVSALLELGTGFHPELTGTENLLLYGSMMGVPRTEMRKRVARIAAFAEIENFIDVPVKNYSTGMYMRLAFSAAIDVEPDLLLVDEVLAVGDQGFQAKCYQRIEQLKREGVSIVLVAHDLGLVERFCEDAIRLEDGQVKGYGPSSEVIANYLKEISPEFVALQQEAASERVCLDVVGIDNVLDPASTGEVAIEKVSVYFPRDYTPNRFPASHPFGLGFQYKLRTDYPRPTLEVRFKGDNPEHQYTFNSQAQHYAIGNLAPFGLFEFSLPGNVLPPDRYLVSFTLGSEIKESASCILNHCLELNLEGLESPAANDLIESAMFRVSFDPFSGSRCGRFHFRDADLKSDYAMLGNGWHEVEFQGLGQRWTKQQAEWVIHNPEGRSHLLITVHAGYKKAGDHPLVGELFQGDQSLGNFVLPDGEWKELRFILADRKALYPRLRMALSETVYAGDFTGGADPRDLGLAVVKIRLV